MAVLQKLVAIGIVIGMSTALHMDEDFDNFSSGSVPLALETPDSQNVPCNFTSHLMMDNPSLSWETPGYKTSGYSNNSDCFWTISAPLGFQLNFTVYHGTSETCCDFVEIFPSDGTDVDSIGKVGGLVDPDHKRVFGSTNGVLTVRFHSDNSVSSQGFSGFFELTTGNTDDDGSSILLLDMDTTMETILATTESNGNVEEEYSITYNTTQGQATKNMSGSPCEFVFMANKPGKHYFSSPGYENQGYENEMYCTYRFSAPERNRIKVTFIDGELEKCCDKIEIKSKLANGNVDSLGGIIMDDIIISAYNSLSFIMTSDSSATRKGFYASYEILPVNETCGNRLMAIEQSMSLSTPGYPDKEYSNNEDCQWIVEAPEGYKVEITVEAGSTEACCDRLSVTEFNDMDENELTTFSGYADGADKVISNLNSVRVRFTSDSSVTDPGYRISYRAVDGSVRSNRGVFIDTSEPNQILQGTTAFPDFPFLSNFTTEMPPLYNSSSPTMFNGNSSEPSRSYSAKHDMEWISRDYDCGYISTLTNSWQNISTPNWPQQYPADSRCRWKFYVPESTTVEILLKAGDTESCCDYVEVSRYDEVLGSIHVIGRKAGLVTREETFEDHINRGYIVIDFISDQSINGRGYTATIRTTTVNEKVGGDFYGNSSYPVNEKVGRDFYGNSSYPEMYGNATPTSSQIRSGLPSVAVNITQISLLPGCTLEQFLDDLVICSSLFVNDFPYKNSGTCRTNIGMFTKCIEKKTEPCREGDLPSILDIVTTMSQESMREEERRALHALTIRPRLDIICDNDVVSTMIRRLSDNRTRASYGRYWQDCFANRNETTFNESYELMLDILKAETSKEFCRLYDTVLAILSRINWADVWMYVRRHIPMISLPSSSYHSIFTLEQQKRIISNLQLPKCMAYQAIAETPTGCLQNKLDMEFVVQVSSYKSEDENNYNYYETLLYIQDIVSAFTIENHRLGLSKYVKNKSMKNQPFIKTEIPSQYFDNADDFRTVLGNITLNATDGEEAYAGYGLNETASGRVNANCTQKIVFIFNSMQNKTSDIAVLRNLISRIKRENVYVFVILNTWSIVMELNDTITEDVGKVIIGGPSRWTLYGVREQIRHLMGISNLKNVSY